MAEKEPFVTVVLDCCYSGSIIRHGVTERRGVRGVKYDAAIDAAYPLDLSLARRPTRDIRQLQGWLINPRNDTILAACGPHETSQELLVAHEYRSGPLSPFLLRALKVSDGFLTIQSLYDHLRLKFHVRRPEQNPMCYGRKDVSFFGVLIPGAERKHISALRVGDKIILDAGSAHGICTGDEFAMFPLGPETDNASGVDYEFEVAVNENDEYHILDRRGVAIRSLPAVTSTDASHISKMATILEHLATFKYVEGIENQTPDRTFEQSFTCYLEDSSNNRVDSGQTLSVRHDEPFTLTVINHGSDPTYLTLFDMGPLWQIEDILTGGGEIFKVVAPGQATAHGTDHTGRLDIPLGFEIPEELTMMGYHDCEDAVKVFVTSRASSFVALESSKLPNSATDLTGRSRGRNDYHELSDFLSSLATPNRRPNAELPDEKWITTTFFVRTVKE
ncbi:uncharacterized protein BDZ99DRAFT_498713 [Mytilinidion resinicola]|uniref:Uncharacterized protein n=1 Tax=Mytilinidion resinicola TaxID=574789 RepID=A0A6A6YMW9_9PEZI|nr:uncharacterized protein BDZ99DRAFT_498713 [Mytilinidion resinicola]KAF2809315.1 hypothetical protein BDZ99DRAFT_498713 [Mytilinidion resinicola]